MGKKTYVKPHRRKNSKRDGTHKVSGHTRTVKETKKMKKGDYPEPKEDYGKKTSYYVLNYLNQDPSRTIRLVRKDDGQIYEVHPKGEEPIKNVWFERRFTEDELQRIEEVHGKLDSIPSDTFEANTDDLVDMIRGKNWKLDDTKFHLWMEERGMV